MNGVSINFGPHIREHAQARGLTVTHDDVEQISRNLNSVTHLEGDTVSFRLGADKTVSIDEAVAMMATGYGKPAAIDAPEVKILPASATATARAVATNIASRDGRAAAMAIEARRVVDTHGNPWVTGNRTHQGFVTNKDPNLAAKLKMQAGTRK